MKTIYLIILAVPLLAALAFQQHRTAQLSAENSALATASTEAVKLREELSQFMSLESTQAMQEEITRLRQENQDLLKLRNEVHELSEQKSELDRLRSENERFRDQARTIADLPKDSPLHSTLIAKENLANLGFRSPEDTIQTLCWAHRENNRKVFSTCFVPARQSENAYLADRLTNITGIEIVVRRNISADTVELGIKIYNGDWSDKIALTLKLIGGEWKVDMDPSYL